MKVERRGRAGELWGQLWSRAKEQRMSKSREGGEWWKRSSKLGNRYIINCHVEDEPFRQLWKLAE